MAKVKLEDALMTKKASEPKPPREPGFQNKWLKPEDFDKDGLLECVFIKKYIDPMYGQEKFEVADKDGNEKHLPTAGSLKWQINQGIEAGLIESGTRIEVGYNGMKFVQKFNRDIHDFEVSLFEG